LALDGFDVLDLWAAVRFLVVPNMVAVGRVGFVHENFKQNTRYARENLGADTRLWDILDRGLGGGGDGLAAQGSVLTARR